MTGATQSSSPKLLTLWRLHALLGALGMGVLGGFLAFGLVRGAMQLDSASALQVSLVVAAICLIGAALLGELHARRAFAYYRWERQPNEGIVVWNGAWWQREIWIPMLRLQHLDVVRGPLERRLGLAALELHTAGSHDHKTRLPGLDPDVAVALRDALLGELQAQAPSHSAGFHDSTARDGTARDGMVT